MLQAVLVYVQDPANQGQAGLTRDPFGTRAPYLLAAVADAQGNGASAESVAAQLAQLAQLERAAVAQLIDIAAERAKLPPAAAAALLRGVRKEMGGGDSASEIAAALKVKARPKPPPPPKDTKKAKKAAAGRAVARVRWGAGSPQSTRRPQSPRRPRSRQSPRRPHSRRGRAAACRRRLASCEKHRSKALSATAAAAPC